MGEYSFPMKNVFVLGLDPRNHRKLKNVLNAEQYNFLELCRYDELRRDGKYRFSEILHKASTALREFDGPVDAVISYWDFPASSIVPILCEQQGLPSASLASVIKCEHKYWSRLEQKKVVPEHVPGFQAVNPFDDAAEERIELAYPFWLKPIKAHSSQLGFRIHDRRDLQSALAHIRRGIWRFAEPFNAALSHVQLPTEVRDIDGNHCIAEQMVHGSQCTIEGYVLRGEPTVYGVVDSIRDKNHSSFLRYQYPSGLPKRVQREMSDISCRLVTALGYDNATFNIEFFWDRHHDRLWLLEINPRLSQSHSEIFEKVDGVTNLDKMVEVALGRAPQHREGAGEVGVAAKCFLRHWHDALVRRVPTQQEVHALEQAVPGAVVEIVPEQGQRLSQLSNQDSYSYELALIHLGAHDQHELVEKYRRCAQGLHFDLDEDQGGGST